MSNEAASDPCGEFGPTQRWALVWFAVTLIGGTLLTCKLATFDREFYDSLGYVLDYGVYAENREAFTTVPSEPSDPRTRGSYTSAALRARMSAAGSK